MKCPKCDYNQRRGKEGMTCKKCRYRFALDPQLYDRFNDRKFLSILRNASQNETSYFTEDELYHHACLRQKENYGYLAVGCFLAFFLTFMLMGVIGLILDKNEFNWSEMSIILGVVIIFLIFLLVRFIPASLPREKWDKILRVWLAHNTVPHLIKGHPLTKSPEENPSIPDLYDYGASRLIICEKDIQVDWLIKNNFHTAHQAVIISEHYYPAYLKPQIEQLIHDNPDLKITLLHNTGTKGEGMKTRIMKDWGIKAEQVTDAGLSESMLDTLKVRPWIRKNFGDVFPLHALPYQVLQTLLAVSLKEHHEEENTGTLSYAWGVTYGDDGDLGGGDGDFG